MTASSYLPYWSPLTAVTLLKRPKLPTNRRPLSCTACTHASSLGHSPFPLPGSA
uniref:Uncharacterized protein n=1 Tax=Arundo donax TaxID=35708 RepID=A0A0A9GPK8_ARUDO